jgi:glycosyltransferase involved in cell wall biosynthesis
VVTDFTPSASQFIKDGENGCLVGTKEGWYNALESLISSAELRNKFSRNLKGFIEANFSPEINFKVFLNFLFHLFNAPRK